jgi:glucose-1-phosphate adenylyltransferase
VDIGRNCHIQRAVIDRSCSIAPDTTIGYDRAADEAAGFYVSEGGVTLVTPDMLGQQINRVR